MNWEKWSLNGESSLKPSLHISGVLSGIISSCSFLPECSEETITDAWPATISVFIFTWTQAWLFLSDTAGGAVERSAGGDYRRRKHVKLNLKVLP